MPRITITPSNRIDRFIAGRINKANQNRQIVGYHIKQMITDIRTAPAPSTSKVA